MVASQANKGVSAVLLIAIIIIAVVAGVVGFYAGQTAGYKAGYEAAKPAGPTLPDKIKIGSLMALSGFLGPMGGKIVKGVELAVDEINAHGGIAGRPVELIAVSYTHLTLPTKA